MLNCCKLHSQRGGSIFAVTQSKTGKIIEYVWWGLISLLLFIHFLSTYWTNDGTFILQSPEPLLPHHPQCKYICIIYVCLCVYTYILYMLLSFTWPSTDAVLKCSLRLSLNEFNTTAAATDPNLLTNWLQTDSSSFGFSSFQVFLKAIQDLSSFSDLDKSSQAQI